jgi:peptide deformylase
MKAKEGCLSLMYPKVIIRQKRRRYNVILKYQTLNDPYQKTRKFMGALGPYSRVIQHEYDHLRGKLCID